MIVWDGEAEDGGKGAHGQEMGHSAFCHLGRGLEEWATAEVMVMELVMASILTYAVDFLGCKDGGGLNLHLTAQE